jgi:hypothetical protein
MARRRSVRPKKSKALSQPSIAVETPVGAAIIHTDALLEGIRKKSIREVPTVPKWLAKLTTDERKRMQRCFRQTFLDMKVAAKGTDEDLSFAYAHFKLDALRTACGFFSQFLFEKQLKIDLKPPKTTAPVKTRRNKPNDKQMTFADLFFKTSEKRAPNKKPVNAKSKKRKK